MAIRHAYGQNHRRHAIRVEMVGVRTAARFLEFHREAQLLRRTLGHLDGRAVLRDLIRAIVRADFRLDLAAGFPSALLEMIDNALRDRIEFLLVAAARLIEDIAGICYDIRGTAALDASDIAGRFFIDAPLRSIREQDAGSLDGIDALLRLHPGMCSLALDGDMDLVLARGLVAHDARMAVRIEREAEIRMQQAAVKILRAMHAVFLSNREYDLQRSVRDFLFLELAQRLEDSCDASLIIRTQHGRAIGTDDAVLNLRMDVSTGLDTVHMSRQHDGRRINRARKIRHEIAAIATELDPSLIFMDRATEFLKAFGQEIAHLALLARGAADLHQFEKFLQNTLAINHHKDFLSSFIIA